MASISVFDEQGAEVGSFDVDLDALAPTVNRQLLHDAVVMYQANRRQGSHKTKSRAEVSGSTRKMYRQKGTGNARAGSRRSGVRRGGGHIFALRPRDYSYRLPKKALRAATKMAMRSRVEDGGVVLLKSLSFSEPKTSLLAGLLEALPGGLVSTLLVTDGVDANVYKSGRNIRGVEVRPVEELNAELLLRPRRIVLVQGAMKRFLERVGAAVPVQV